MANNKNLTGKGFKGSTEKASKAGKVGGVASGIAKRRIKDMNELAAAMLNCSVPDKEVAAIKTIFPEMDEADITHATSLLLAQVKKARKGNTEAFKAVRDTAGYNPINKNAEVDKSGNDKQIVVAKQADADKIDKLDNVGKGKKDA